MLLFGYLKLIVDPLQVLPTSPISLQLGMNINNKNSWNHQGLPIFGVPQPNPYTHSPQPNPDSISPPPQAKWTEGFDCWDEALVVTGRWLLGIRRVGPKKNILKTWILGWWMIWWFVLFNDFYFTLIMRIWFVDFVSNDLVGWNTWPDLFNMVFWLKTHFLLPFLAKKKCFHSPNKKPQFRTFFLRQSHMISRRVTHITLASAKFGRLGSVNLHLFPRAQRSRLFQGVCYGKLDNHFPAKNDRQHSRILLDLGTYYS